MALIKIELTEEHLLLLKHLSWDLDLFAREGDEYILPKLVEDETFGNGHIYETMGIILDGPDKVIDPNNTIDFRIDALKKARFDKLLLELPMALDIVLYTQEFKSGLYKRKSNLRDWKLSD